MEDALRNFVVVVAPGVCGTILVLVERVDAAMELVGTGLGDGEDFAEAARQQTEKLRKQVNQCRG